MRQEVDSLIAATHQDMWTAWSSSNTAITHRLGEGNDTRNKLLAHRDRVREEMGIGSYSERDIIIKENGIPSLFLSSDQNQQKPSTFFLLMSLMPRIRCNVR